MSMAQLPEDNLTEEQRISSQDKTREVLCLACAGSGKSRTLAYRIARLMAEREEPESIVAFTFTKKAAESIKRRVSEAMSAWGLDPLLIGKMFIGTMDAYCHRVLGDLNAKYRQFDVLDENRLKLYLISRYSSLGLRKFRDRARNNSYFDTIGKISDAWKTANNELLDFSDVRNDDVELGDLLLHIKESLLKDEFMDFSLAVREVVQALQENADGVEQAVGALRHLMVDEYQDVNPCQHELIRLLHERSDTLFVVGDDDQAIYAWRGADVSNILEFNTRYPQCNTHTLSQNFRSTSTIVDASDAFVSATLGPSRMPKNPTAAQDKQPQDCRVLWFPEREGEAGWVAQRIRELLETTYEDDGHERGLTPADFAVLMRSTRQPEQDDSPRHAAFTSALEKVGIPFSLESGGGPFDRPQTEVLRSTFELLRNGPVDRGTVDEHFEAKVKPAYPDAHLPKLRMVLGDWGRQISTPQSDGGTRILLYPQKLVYDLLAAFNVAQTGFSDDVMRDIGLFSKMILDVETVYLSVDSRSRFAEVLNFLQNVAENGYDVSTDDIIRRPDTVTVSTVHKMKGLEFPVVFVVDVEAQRFPKRRSSYDGWLPPGLMADAIGRGAYRSTHEEEIRLFYTAATRAERFLYISGAANRPGGRRAAKKSDFALRFASHPSVGDSLDGMPQGITKSEPRRSLEDSDYPTSFTEVRSYLSCPKNYQFQERYGFNPVVPGMFGYGRTVHTSIQKLHDLHPHSPPPHDDIREVIEDTFHLKHVPASRDQVNRPGPYENARNAAVGIGQRYVGSFGTDFQRKRQLEAVFEIPASDCVITGSIDLMLLEDEAGNILDAEIIDFKTMDSQQDVDNTELNWTELALQVQLYAKAADQLLGQNAKTGNVHFLKDGQRVQVPVTPEAVDAAIDNIEWAVRGILGGDFPMRPHPTKCESCDFRSICPQVPQDFETQGELPPALHLPSGREMAWAFSRYQPDTFEGRRDVNG